VVTPAGSRRSGRRAPVVAAVAGALLATLLGAVAVLADGISGAYMEAVLSDGPSAFYPLDTRSTTAFDDSGHGHNATFQGSGGEQSGLTLGVVGPLNAQQNGPNYGVTAAGVTVAEAPNAAFLPAGNAPRTLEGWFKSSPATQPDARYPIVAWGGPGGGRAYGLVVMQHAVVLDYFDGTTSFSRAPNMFDGRWHYVVATYDGNVALAYVDGVEVGVSPPMPKAFINTQSPSTLIIGDWIDHVINSSLQGSVADVAVYPFVLDGARIKAHFSAAGGAVSSGGGPSTIALSLPSPADAFGSAGIVLASAAVAVAGTLFITFPAQLFNLTLQENYPTIAGWIAPVRKRLAALGSALQRLAAPRRGTAETAAAEHTRIEWPAFALVVAVGALFGGFLDPGFGFNTASVESYVAIVLSMLAGITVAGSVSEVYHRRRHGPVRRHLRALPLGLVLGLVCVLLSRLAGFQPGYLYGVVCGVAFEQVLTARESGHVAALSTLAVICTSVLAWLLWVPLNAHAAAQGAFPLLVVLDDFLAALLVGGLVGSVIGLLPLRFLPGGTIREWNPRAWLAIFGVAVFALVEFVIRSPASSGAHHSGLILTIVLFVVFAGVSVGFREYFAARWRREHGVTVQSFGARLHQLVTPREAEPVPSGEVAGVAVSGSGAGSAMVTDEVAPPPEPTAPTPRA